MVEMIKANTRAHRITASLVVQRGCRWKSGTFGLVSGSRRPERPGANVQENKCRCDGQGPTHLTCNRKLTNRFSGQRDRSFRIRSVGTIRAASHVLNPPQIDNRMVFTQSLGLPEYFTGASDKMPIL
jgi:hypothetical protein